MGDEGKKAMPVSPRLMRIAGAACATVLGLLPCPAQTAPDASPASPATTAAVPPSPQLPLVFAVPPVAIVPLDKSIHGAALSVSGSMQAWNGRAFLTGNASITAGTDTAEVTLPYRGSLRVCASTTVNLAMDTSVPPAAGVPAAAQRGMLLAIDHGALEMSFAAAPAESNADILMTPDFRILIGGPGASDLKVRLGNGGDTCIDNSGGDAPYVVVTSLFDTGIYRVQPGQRVMFQHGSLREVVDREKEPCGCPPPPSSTTGNEFPLAQSQGLSPLPPIKQPDLSAANRPAAVPPLVYSVPEQQSSEVTPVNEPSPNPPTPAPPAPPSKKPGVFARLGHFFRKIFGAE